jgi:hypothetical protein
MKIEKNVFCLHPHLGVDGLEFCTHISNYSDSNLDLVMAEWADEKEVSISLNFKLSSALDSIIESHEMPAYDHAIHDEARPMISDMRAGLVKMLERIDMLKFSNGNDD